jgi:hypothetical protein
MAEARSIRDALGDDLADWKQGIDDAIAAGSTGTEILMALRWNFDELQRTKAVLSNDLVARIKNFISVSDELLG